MKLLNKENNIVTSKNNFMLYIPNKKHEKWEVKNNKVYLIFEHNKCIEKLIRWLFKRSKISDIELDEIGTKVWFLINGNNTIYTIGQKLLEEYGNECEPVYDRLIMYLGYLNRKGWIKYKI